MNELYEECKSDVARKYGLGKTLVIGHLPKYYEEAAMLYAQQQVKKCELANVVGRSEQLFCDEHTPKVKYDWQKGHCLTCAKKLEAK